VEPPPQFSAHFYCGQTAGCIKMPLSMDGGLSPGEFVLDGDPAVPSQKRRRSPQFSAHVYCGKNGWMDQDGTWHGGMEVGLGPVHIVLDGAQLPPQKGAEPPIFGPVAKRLDASRCHLVVGMEEVGLIPGDFVLDGDPAPYPKRGGAQPNFRPRLL